MREEWRILAWASIWIHGLCVVGLIAWAVGDWWFASGRDD